MYAVLLMRWCREGRNRPACALCLLLQGQCRKPCARLEENPVEAVGMARPHDRLSLPVFETSHVFRCVVLLQG